jgi:hypothetical protein
MTIRLVSINLRPARSYPGAIPHRERPTRAVYLFRHIVGLGRGPIMAAWCRRTVRAHIDDDDDDTV